MPKNVDTILESVNNDNIDDYIYFYSFVLEKLVEKKMKYEKEEDKIFISLKKLNIENEVSKLKNHVSRTESEDVSTSDSE
jgi:hypothetical protein